MELGIDFNPRTPSQECDIMLIDHFYGSKNFNPRTPSQECDRFTESNTPLMRISIHALPRKNATLTVFAVFTGCVISIHALPRKNATSHPFVIPSVLCKFQSTHSLARMRRYSDSSRFCTASNFNPRTPSQECDFLFTLPHRRIIISIHALPRKNATKKIVRYSFFRDISIHALPRKNATLSLACLMPSTTISIHALPRKNATT